MRKTGEGEREKKKNEQENKVIRKEEREREREEGKKHTALSPRSSERRMDSCSPLLTFFSIRLGK
jgi:hypothetical protein